MSADLFSYAPSYPHVPGYKSRETSCSAAEDVKATAASLRAKCLSILQMQEYQNGLTADEVATLLNGQSVLSIRPRFSELVNKGKIKDTGDRRLNASGKRAIVWAAA